MEKITILIVEDEPIQRIDLAEVAMEAGFDVIEAANADAAIAILETRTDIRLVFTDIEMPGSMDGVKLAAAVRSRWPPIAIIVTSAGKAPDPALLPEQSVFMPKPLHPREAIATIRRLAA